MQTLAAFIRTNRIRMDAELTDSNPNMDLDEWSRTATHWRCTLKIGKHRMTTYFSQGSAHSTEPTAEDLLDCLASDAVGVRNASGFEDWAAGYGYSPDSRKAEKTYQTCEKQADRLEALLGPEAFETLLYNTERQ